MLLFSHTPGMEAVITIREVPREAPQMSDGSPLLSPAYGWEETGAPRAQRISQLSQRAPR